MEPNLSEEEKRDALEALYSSSFSGYVISFAASTIMVITFFDDKLGDVKTIWWGMFNCLIALRLYDSLYWKKWLQNTEFDTRRVFRRFYLGCTTTAVFWLVYVLLVLPVGKIPELAFVFVVKSTGLPATGLVFSCFYDSICCKFTSGQIIGPYSVAIVFTTRKHFKQTTIGWHV